MKTLREDAFSSPLYHIITVALLAVGLVSIPLEKLVGLFIKDTALSIMLGGIVLRLVLFVLALIAVKKYGFIKPFRTSDGIVKFLLCLPALVVALNNFPILAFIQGKLALNDVGTLKIIIYVFYCVLIGAFEQIVFCGIVFPLFIVYFKEQRQNLFLPVIFTALVFGLSHLTNLLGGADFTSTLLQVCYSFLISAMCITTVVITKSIYTAIFLHATYDFGGLILNKSLGMATGSAWNTLTITVTAVIGVVVAVYFLILIFKHDYKDIQSLYFTKDELN